MLLLPCDVMFARSHSRFGAVIRFFTRGIRESRTVASHTGLIVESGIELQAVVIEALAHTKRHKLVDEYGNCDTELCVFRPLNLTIAQEQLILAKAASYVGKDYGYFKLLLHLGDWALQGAYFFRRLGRVDRYPICSLVVARAFKAAGKDFGVADYAASPDDIWDHVISHIGKHYAFVWQRGTMYKET